MGLKLSQIIFYVERNTYKEDIWSFRTKNQENLTKIRFTYLDYVVGERENKSKNSFDIIEEKIDAERSDTLIISDNYEVLEEAVLRKIPCLALTSMDDFVNLPAEYCVSDIGQLSFDHIMKIWQRQVGLPWIIGYTDRMLIREQTIDDIEEIYDMYSDPATSKYMEDIDKDIDILRRNMKDYIDHQYKFYEYGLWTLLDKETGKYVGRAGLSNREGFDEVELGYVISSQFRNMGFAREACLEIMEYAHTILDINSLLAFTKEDNCYSVSLLKGLGFSFCKTVDIDEQNYHMYRKNL